MGLRLDPHRPLVSGIFMSGGVPTQDASGNTYIRKTGEGGTLTGLATRNHDNHKMLVTNLHTLVGVSAMLNPPTDVVMYQEERDPAKKVGKQHRLSADNS